MPSETFLNLPSEKRERITSAALNEFARVRFSLASINRIVKEAGIPRGSFYQYFTDKEDLFAYIMDLISQEKIDLLVEETASSTVKATGLFAPLLARMPAIFSWADRNPLYYRIGLLLATEEPDIIQTIFQRQAVGTNWFMDYLNTARDQGLIRPDADLAMVADLLRSYAATLLQAYYNRVDTETILDTMKRFFCLLEYGITANGGHPNETGDSSGQDPLP